MTLTDVAILFGVTIGLPLLGYAWQRWVALDSREVTDG